jgi:hypothetical protein
VAAVEAFQDATAYRHGVEDDSQPLTRLNDGSVRAEFELSSLEEVKSSVLSLEAKAGVEDPKDSWEQ